MITESKKLAEHFATGAGVHTLQANMGPPVVLIVFPFKGSTHAAFGALVHQFGEQVPF